MMRRVLAAVLVLLAATGGWLVYAWNDRPSIERRLGLMLPAAAAGAPVRVTFLGVSTLLFDDGDSAILIDGFFSRPSLLRTALTRIEPDGPRIEESLRRAGAEHVAAVVVVHSHYDHAMDAPEVARRTGALLVGSESTANVGRGAGLAEERIRVVRGSETLAFGRWRVAVIPSRHFPHGMAMGEISAPLRTPARAADYLEGGSFSLLLENGERSFLVQGSAGYVPGALRGRRAEIVFLGIGGLGSRDDAYRDEYWREVVASVGARRVIPIHWDDFSRPLTQPLRPLPRLLDDFDISMDFLVQRAAAGGVDVQLVDAWQKVDPYAGL